MPPVQTATTDAQILACWPVLHLLRPHLQPDTFLPQIRAMQQQGYELLYLQDGPEVVAVAGFRYLHQFYAGRLLYLDDLATLPTAQRQGYAGYLLAHLQALARERCLDGVALDSGFRNDNAHRLYLRQGFGIVAFHFLKRV